MLENQEGKQLQKVHPNADIQDRECDGRPVLKGGSFRGAGGVLGQREGCPI